MAEFTWNYCPICNVVRRDDHGHTPLELNPPCSQPPSRKPLSMSEQFIAVNDALTDENKQLRRLVCELLNARENVDEFKDHQISELPLTENDKAILRRVMGASEVKNVQRKN